MATAEKALSGQLAKYNIKALNQPNLFFGVVPRLYEGFVAVLVKCYPSKRQTGHFYFTVDVNNSTIRRDGYGDSFAIERAIVDSLTMFEVDDYRKE